MPERCHPSASAQTYAFIDARVDERGFAMGKQTLHQRRLQPAGASPELAHATSPAISSIGPL